MTPEEQRQQQADAVAVPTQDQLEKVLERGMPKEISQWWLRSGLIALGVWAGVFWLWLKRTVLKKPLLLMFLMCASANATMYYIDYDSGKDYPTNNGTSTSTPWQHHPFMANGTLTGYTPAAGDEFIFKGGVKWPVVCFPMTITTGGASAAAPDWYTTNGSWGTGNFIFDDALVGANTSAGSLDQMPEGKMIKHDGASYVVWQGLSLTNCNWAGTSSTWGIEWGTALGVILTNCSFACCSNLTGGANSDRFAFCGGVSSAANDGVVTYCAFTCHPNTSYSGYACYYCRIFSYNTVSFIPNGVVTEGTNITHNNIGKIQLSIDPSQHENGVLIAPPPGVQTEIGWNYITNLIAGTIIDCNSYGTNGNVVIHDNLLAGNFGTLTAAIIVDGGDVAGINPGIATVFNNTIQDSEPSGQSQGYIRALHRSGGCDWSRINATNNFFVTEGAGLVQPDPGWTGVVYESIELVINNSTAAADGFTSANGWQPASTSPTRGAGTSMASFCASVGIPWTDLLGVAFISDVGAYEFVGSAVAQALSVTGGGQISVTGGGQIIVK